MFYGRNLNLAHPDLTQYFEEARTFDEGLKGVFRGSLDLQTRIARTLSALDEGRPYEAPPGPEPGQRYMFTTLREHPAGGFIPAHFDDEQSARPSYRFLNPLLERKLLSFVLAFSEPESGGDLEIFDISPSADGLPTVANGRSAVDDASAQGASFRCRLKAGEMIVFRSGHFLHRLNPVEGTRIRWTACSFMSVAKDQSRVYCWG